MIYVVPELKIDGLTVKTGKPVRLGEELPLATAVNFAGRGVLQAPRIYNVTAGSYLAVNAYAGSVSPQILADAKTRLEHTKAALESANPSQIAALTREDLLGDMFHAGGLGYYAQLTALSHIMGIQTGAHHTLASGTGTFGYEPKVNYFFGLPRSIKPGGVVFDIAVVAAIGVNDGHADRKKQFVLQVGALGSALEHAVPEQMFVNAQNPGEAISAVKALQKANQQGQRIYHITKANQSAILPNIHHDSDTMAEIRDALNAGKEVVTHTDAVSVPGWAGAGYVITDPVKGDGAYRIAGGENGSYLTFLGMALAFLQALAPFFIATPWIALLVGVAGFMAHILMVLSLVDNKIGMAEYALVRMITMVLTIVLIIVADQILFMTFPLLFVLSVIGSVISALISIYQILKEVLTYIYRREKSENIFV
jgi:hypothetical protein